MVASAVRRAASWRAMWRPKRRWVGRSRPFVKVTPLRLISPTGGWTCTSRRVRFATACGTGAHRRRATPRVCLPSTWQWSAPPPKERSPPRGNSTDVKLGLLVETEDGLDWDHWRATCAAADELGFESVWISDHLQSPWAAGRHGLDPWIALAVAAAETRRITLGVLVSPIMFREAAIVARMAEA